MVAWILGLAPGGGVDLPEEIAYQNLQHDCILTPQDGSDDPYYTALSAQERRLYEGAAAACRAAFYDEPDQWPVAEAALAQIDAVGADFTCLGDVAYEVLRELVAVHTTDPTARLVRGDGPGRGPACPRVISLEPDHGAASGGYRIHLVGEHLPSTSVIHFGDVDLTVQTDGDSASLIVPPAPVDAEWSAGEHSVQVWVEGWYMQVFNTPTFVYELEPRPRPSPGTVADPTASPGG
ncbi:IPT/TIG domain-containing protein [Blastococcus mobilis]|uniref:IPT/TIG domain-containing protein n=1 Tax=Blastococcus mobilis TaxID=1938746 RepID=A0A238YAK5_9ACTN|nr:IPT/TIG domain-containing protein [Blastococcus mobilis]SNR68296.1 IPT/TIG domain-containing protein [Blastococcus mobilis]